MKDIIKESINNSILTKQKLLDNCYNDINQCGQIIAETFGGGKKLLLCGNGGSAADSQHLAAEFIIRFRSDVTRPALPAIALNVDSSIMTAGSNDLGFENVFARQIEALGRTGDVLIAISTSGNSENIIRAVNQAKKDDMTVIGLLGKNGGKLKELCDYSVIVPTDNTARIQESHILIGHIWCEMTEEILFF